MARRSQKVPKEYLERLRGVSLFATCSDEELARIAELGTEAEVPAGQVIMSEGDVGQDACLVMSGEAICSKGGVELARFGPGDFFGEMALIGNRPRSATVVAGDALTVRAFHASEFRRMMHEVPSIAVKVLWATAERLFEAESAASH